MTKPLHPLDEQLAAGLRGDFERGWELAQELERLSPACNRAAFNRAWYYMMRGDLLKGLELLDRGRWEKVFGDPPFPSGMPIYRDQDLKGKHLLFCAEGGLGDEIINIRFVKDFAARGAKVTVTCDPGLLPVFARVEGVSAAIGHRRPPPVYHDYWVPSMSAAHILGYTFNRLNGNPYLTAHPAYITKWKEILASPAHQPRKKIGLRFHGNPKFEHEQHRRFPPQDLVAAIGDRPWANLQLEETDLPLKNWEDTLALISQLDLIITSCTSVAHASAALGKETWVLVPLLPYYIWALPGETSPWYKSVRLFRQKRPGDWTETFSEIKAALADRPA